MPGQRRTESGWVLGQVEEVWTTDGVVVVKASSWADGDKRGKDLETSNHRDMAFASRVALSQHGFGAK